MASPRTGNAPPPDRCGMRRTRPGPPVETAGGAGALFRGLWSWRSKVPPVVDSAGSGTTMPIAWPVTGIQRLLRLNATHAAQFAPDNRPSCMSRGLSSSPPYFAIIRSARMCAPAISTRTSNGRGHGHRAGDRWARPTCARDKMQQEAPRRLADQEVHELLRQYKVERQQSIRDRIILQYANLVESVARRFSGAAEPTEDL